MRRSRALLVPATVFILSLAMTFGQPQDPSSLPSEAEAASLVYFLEAETLAHDVYSDFFDSWEMLVFSVIAASEEAHAEAIWEKIIKYELEELVASTPPALEDLHEEVMQAADEIEALRAAGLIEETIIQAFEEVHAEISLQCLKVMYDHLYRAARNHLRAFVQHYESLTGEGYELQILDPELFEAIVNSPMERGPYRSGPFRRAAGPWFLWNNTNDPVEEPWAHFTNQYSYRYRGENPDGGGPNGPGDCDSCTGGGGGLRGNNGGDNSGGNGGGNGGGH